MPSPFPSRRETAACAALGLLLLAAYHAFLLPDVPGQGDSAKLQFVAPLLGTPHPSGYPAWVLLAHGFGRLLPWASAAYRANLLTALFSVGASLLLFAGLRRSGTSRGAALAATLAMGLSPTLWSQSVIAEVYTLHLLSLSAVAFFLLRWRSRLEERNADRDLAAALAVWVLSFTNHLTTALLAPAILAFVLLTRPRSLLRPVTLLVTALAAAAAAGLYGYVLWRSHAAAVPFLEMQAADALDLAWRLAADPRRRHLFEADPAAYLCQRLPAALGRCAAELHLLLPLAALGLWRRWEAAEVFFALVAVANFAFAAAFTVPDHFVYFLPVYFAATPFVARGLDRLRRLPVKQAAWTVLLVLFPLAAAVFAAPRIHRQHAARLAVAERLDGLFQRLDGGPALLISDDYEASMGLAYRSLLGEPQIRVRHLPAVAFELPVALAPLHRYLEQGLPLPSRDHPSPVPPGLPVYCACRDAAALRRAGFGVRPLGGGFLRLEADRSRTAGRGPLPRALFVTELETVETLPEGIDRLRDPHFPLRRRALRLGRHRGIEGRPGSDARVAVVRWDEAGIEVALESSSAGWLLLTEPLPERWRPSVDGRRVRRWELDLLYPGVAVPAGRHRVELSPD